MAMGEIGIFPDMADAAPGIANVFFVSFVFIVVSPSSRITDAAPPTSHHSIYQVFVLFNVLLAIIVDAYQGAVGDSVEAKTIAQDAAFAISRLSYNMSGCRGKPIVSSQRLLLAASTFVSQVRS